MANELYCSNPECGEDILGWCVIVSDPSSDIDWASLGVANILHSEVDGISRQSLVLHQSCFMELFNAIMRGEHSVVLEVAAGPVGTVKEEMFG